MLHITINAKGKTLGDIELALEEAMSRFKAGNTSGFDRNESGSFNFDLGGEEEFVREESED